jgi:hypothetical protein
MPVDILDCFAPGLMLERVMSMIAEKLLEVALDLQGMTPDLQGMTPDDAYCLHEMSSRMPTPTDPRLARAWCRPTHENGERTIGRDWDALCRLAGLLAPLTKADFEVGERLFKEAVSMILPRVCCMWNWLVSLPF